jgi:hypothetical protein
MPLLCCCGQAGAQAMAVPARAVAEPTLTSATAGPTQLAAAAVPTLPGASRIEPAEPASVQLPAHYTIELRPEGRIYADGRSLGGDAELGPDARAAASRGGFAGAVVFADPRVGEQRALGARQELRAAGFEVVLLVERAAPTPISAAPRPESGALRAQAAVEPVGAVEEGSPAAKAPDVGSPEPESMLILKTVGLHIGGAPNDEPSRQHFVRQFETKFDDFRRCYPLAENASEQNAGFGVDLLIPARGGKPRLRQARSRLLGKRFRRCMRDAFVSLRFARPRVERSVTVSYSLIFKPRGD